jgi:hypothetical protein
MNGVFMAITRAMLFASVHGPSFAKAIHTLDPKRFATCVSLIAGRACNPPTCVRTARA